MFLSKPSTVRPVVEIEAAESDDLALRVPFEFLPIAPAMQPRLAERENLEQFLGFRAEIVRSLRSGPVEIRRNSSGRTPIHLFADAGDGFRGMRKETEYLRVNAMVASRWPDWQAHSQIVRS